jgi:phenylalanyl-tRNA synthetase beta chain
MQISEAWLRARVNPAITTNELVEQLTMAGLEVDSVNPVAAEFSNIVVGEILTIEKHPNADKLNVCTVAVGKDQPLQIVCGANNVRVGLKIPTALIGAVLPGNFNIKKSKLRGVFSFGMLCSETELGLADSADGLMVLAIDAPIGIDIRAYLSLNDTIIELDLTPNRADCLSVEGIAREVSVLNEITFEPIDFKTATVKDQEIVAIKLDAAESCPRYLGRLIKGINPKAPTPLWMQARLRCAGLRSLGGVIDVTNYVLLELGQPLHAFDAVKLTGAISVRYAHEQEALTLLNEQTIVLETDSLVIADQRQALALAGIMGGRETAVSETTTDIFLECAFFTPTVIAGKARKYGLHTDSSHRFERGVDPFLQQKAIERATQLIVKLAGGNVGAINEVVSQKYLPTRSAVRLRKSRITKILGIEMADAKVVSLFERLGMIVKEQGNQWMITPPSARFDIAIEADLIEEIARIYGYNHLPKRHLLIRAELADAPEGLLPLEQLQDLLVVKGYQEAITYSFVDEAMQQLIAPDDAVIKLQNPISSELSVMRSTLWGGLLATAVYNTHRQQTRVRLFETGLVFVKQAGETLQTKKLAGLALGAVRAEQWGEKIRKIDFFDLKADVESLCSLSGLFINYTAEQHTALQPGQTAKLTTIDGLFIGWIGLLHPLLEKKLGFETSVFLFELELTTLLNKRIPSFTPLSRFPSVRRDMAIVVNETVCAKQIIQCISDCQQAAIYDIQLFDIYQGQGVEIGYKSVALSLYLQDCSQTLAETEIDAIFSTVLTTLTEKIGAKLRE